MSKALKEAIEKNDSAAVAKAMKTVKDLGKKLPKADTPVIFACEIGADAALKVLLEGKAPVSRSDLPHLHPLAAAARNGHAGAVKVLAEHEAIAAEVVDHAMYIAVRGGHEEPVRAMLAVCKPKVSQQVLSVAARGDGKVLRLFLDQGADVDSRNDGKDNREMRGMTALHIMAREGNLNGLRALLDAGASVNAEDAAGRTPLMCFAERIDGIESEKAFFERRRAKGIAIPGGVEEPPDAMGALGLLLKAGADARKMDRFGNDALMYYQWECQRDRVEPKPEFVEALEKAGAQGGGATIGLFIAMKTEDVAGMKRAIKAGADVNRVSPNHGATPLIWCRSAEQLSVLLEAGADVNKAGLKSTPLISAARGGALDVVKGLVEAGADIHAIEPGEPGDEYIANAYSAAQMNDKPEVVAYLKSLGAGQPRRRDWKPLEAGVHSWDDFSETLVKGDVKSVAEGIAKMIGGKAKLGVYGETLKLGKKAFVIVRPKGMNWCNVWQVKPETKRFENRSATEKRCKEIAAACETRVISIEYSDTSDAAQIIRVDGKGAVEVDEGWDQDSLKEVIDQLGKKAPEWMTKMMKDLKKEKLSSTQRVELLAAKEKFIAAAFGFYARGGLVEVDVSGYPAEAFDEAAFVTAT